jgi:hypothetical protein
MKFSTFFNHPFAKISLLATCFFAVSHTQAQTWLGSGISTFTADNVQIGQAFLMPPPNPQLYIETAVQDNNNKTALHITNRCLSTFPPNKNIVEVVTSSDLPGGVSTIYKQFIITAEGKVQIGNVPVLAGNTYRLFVERGILTEKVKVASKTGVNWADFVFDESYELKPLEEVETFISKNKHLPDVPSAAQVNKDGIDMAQMDATLLQKIEELTLYMIELKKENAQLRKDINALRK